MKGFRIPALVFCLQLAMFTTSAQQPTQSPPMPSQEQPATSAAVTLPPAPEQIRSAVSFLMVAYQNGSTQGSAIGSCFFVVFPDATLAPDPGFVHLVTNPRLSQ